MGNKIGAPERIETQRLLMRQFEERDLDGFAAICGDAEVRRYMANGRAMNRQDAWRAMASALGHWRLRGFGMYAVELGATGELVGRIGFLQPEGWPGFELGWMLARPHWGRGLALEGASAALAIAFEVLVQSEVISLIHVENARSARLAERLGQSVWRTEKVNDTVVNIYGIRASGHTTSIQRPQAGPTMP